MLLTIHNLPSNMRYADIKSLIGEKCGLTEIILDNLVAEGRGKKVTVGLANEDDGALVVRKINGLYIHGQQLYIEDRRRKTDVHSQPYRSSASLTQDVREPEPVHPNMMATVAAPNMAMAWNYNMAATPYMVMPVDQNFAYPSYGGVPQSMQYMEPQPVVPAVNERGYSGFQGEDAPGNGPKDLDPVAWGRSGRKQPSDSYRHQDRKRHHSPEKPSAVQKKASRLGEKEAPRRREVSPPRKQRPQERNQGPRPPLRQPDQFARNQNQYQPRELDNRRTDTQWDPQSRWDEPKPRSESGREWGNDNNRDWEPNTDKVWNDQPNPQRRGERRERWNDEPNPEWDNQPNPQWDDQPSPHWERDSRMPMEEVRSEWYDRHPAAGSPPGDSPPRQINPERGFSREIEPRHQDADFNRRHEDNRNVPRDWDTDVTPRNLPASRSNGSFPRHVRREDEIQRRDGPRSSDARPGRGRRDDRIDRPRSPRDRSGGQRENPDYWRQVANDYPVSEKPGFDRRDAPKASRHDTYDAPRNDRKPTYKPDAPRKPIPKEANKYPPVDDRRLPSQKPNEPRFDNSVAMPKKPQTLTSMINKDHSNRGQATAAIAKKIVGVPAGSSTYLPGSALEAFVFKQLKWCIRSRIDVMLGEELSSDVDDVIKRYRLKFPASGDRPLLKQIREKSTKEYAEKQEKWAKEREQGKQVKEEINVKKEPIDIKQTNPQGNVNAPVEASSEVPKEGTTEPENKPVTAVTVAQVKPIPMPLPKTKTRGKKKPPTDKQVIRQMKIQRKLEYDQDGIYKLDPASDKALGDEVAELTKLFIEECAKTDDPQEEVITNLITTESLNDFNKTIRLYITKRLLNIETGLVVRIFSAGKLPKRIAVEQYLKSLKILNPVLKKSVKGFMYVVNLCRFKDFDNLCRKEQDVIDGTPVNFKAMHLAGPPRKMSRKEVLQRRQQTIQRQIESNVAPRRQPGADKRDYTGQVEENVDYSDDVTGDDSGQIEENVEQWDEALGDDSGQIEENVGLLDEAIGDDYGQVEENVGNWDEEAGDDSGQIGGNVESSDIQETEDFADDINVGGFNEDELEDF